MLFFVFHPNVAAERKHTKSPVNVGRLHALKQDLGEADFCRIVKCELPWAVAFLDNQDVYRNPFPLTIPAV